MCIVHVKSGRQKELFIPQLDGFPESDGLSHGKPEVRQRNSLKWGSPDNNLALNKGLVGFVLRN
jgi:hypothetical protein